MKSSKKPAKRLLLLLIILALLVSGFFLLPKHVQRYFYWNYADVHDFEKFPHLAVKNNEADIFQFAHSGQNQHFSVPAKFSGDAPIPFETFLEDHSTLAFLVAVDDSIIYENYFAGYNQDNIIPSFSVSKAFVSALTGIAIDEGYIYSTNQSITFFLNELKPSFDDITIEDLLNMRSGIRFNEGYNTPFADMAKYYYGTDLLDYIKYLSIEDPPDKKYNYISVNTLLLSQIIERATGTKLNVYLEKKIWRPLGMESDATWSIDSEESQTIKAFCCINAVARDFLKFGRLYLNHGNWDGNQVVPENWVKRSTSIINDSRDSQNYPYTYQWRVLENGSFFAKGILGQYIFVYPEKNLVFVRMGKSYGGIDWAQLFLEISDQIGSD
ncbi:MAG: serine hydrolase [Bacteroidales bacterium]|nr:serine hydrolase [Bacteroidales bacterium]